MRPEATEVRSRVVRPRPGSRPGPARKKSTLRRLALEGLEPRALLAVLPPATVTGQVDISNTPTNGHETAPSIAVDPTNSQKLVAVWTRDTPNNNINNNQTSVFVEGAYSTNAGQSWTSLSGTLGNTRTDFDQSQANGARFFAQVTDAGVAFDRNGQFYVISSPHSGDYGAGEILLQKFDFSGSVPAQVFSDQPVYRWTQDPAFRPVLAVDSNLDTFTDPDVPGYVQTDAFTGNVYVAWSTNNVAPDPVPTNFNPNVIKIVASSDAATAGTTANPNPPTFTTQQYVNDSRNIGLDRNATPRLAISQGRPIDTAVYGPGDLGVPGGQVTIVWDDTSTRTGENPPLDRIMSSRITDGGTGIVVAGNPGGVRDAVDPGGGGAHIPGVTPDPTNPLDTSNQAVVNITDPKFTTLTDLDVTVNLTHNNLSEIRIELIPPPTSGLATVTLLNNRVNSAGTANNNTGASGANLGSTTGGTPLRTVFDQDAPRSIFNNAGGTASTGNFRPEFGSLNFVDPVTGAPLTAAQLSGTWTLRITDFRASGTVTPAPRLNSWSLNFTSGLTDTGNDDSLVATTLVRGAVNANAAPLLPTVAPNLGIAPAPVVASDNTLGAFSPHQGRLYVAYVSRPSFTGTPADNTDISLAYSDNGGRSWQTFGFGQVINDDNAAGNPLVRAGDGFSESNGINGRPQFQPAATVDPATGTLVVTFLDARDDAARARVATYIATSIDGGATFSPQTFANAAEVATDAITDETRIRGPLPENQSSGNGTRSPFGFGHRQDVAAANGRIFPVWAGNNNGGADGARRLDIFTAQVVIANGPRVVDSTMGPVGQPGDTINATRAADGTPQASNFLVTFDRPVDPDTFDAADVRLVYRSPAGVTTDLTATAGITVTPVLVSDPDNPNGRFGFTTFNVGFTPQSGVGTYSYSVGPDVQDRIRTTFVPGLFTSTDVPLRIPPSGTGGTGIPAQDRTLSTLTVSGIQAARVIADLNVNLTLSHTFDGDLDIFLIAPNGTRVELSTNNGGGGNNYTGTVFDDEAATSIAAGFPAAFPPFTGSFRPEGLLSVLDGLNPNGTWRLEITDEASTDIGTLLSWSLDIQLDVAQSGVRSGNPTDQDADSTAGEPLADAYTTPRLLAGGSFPAGPYDRDTLPLIVPGPHVVNTSVPGQTDTSDNLVLNGTVSALDVTFDRDMDPNSFLSAPILRVIGPAGLIVPAPGEQFSFTQVAGSLRTFRINFPPSAVQSLSGTYIVSFGPGLRDARGLALDRDLDAGVDVLFNRGATTVPLGANSTDTPQPIPDATAATPGVLTSTITVTDNFLIPGLVPVPGQVDPITGLTAQVGGITVQLNIQHPGDPDLQATLIYHPGLPDERRIRLFRNVGTAGNQANFTNTIFDDAATTPIQNGGPPFFGRFNPEQSLLTALAGLPAAGDYTLEILDTTPTRTGTLLNWSLSFRRPVDNTGGLGEPVADDISASFRIFTMDPTNRLASSTWTAVGPASNNGNGNSGRIGGLALDPSDPSGNTVYVGGASGGIWKSSNFLTTDPLGPTYIPLTDFGPTLGINIGGIAVFGRNNDPNQSIVFAATGEGDTSTFGVGFLRSMDGGATWTLLDSTDNTLPFAQRDHFFARRTTSFKVIVDPRLTPNGEVIVYAALSGVDSAAGIWRSLDTGRTWQRLLAGQATDVLLDPNSGTGVQGGNLQFVYAAIRGQGVFFSPNRGQTFTLVAGGVGNPLIRDADRTQAQVNPVASETPNGPKGRIVLAKPFLTGNAVQDLLYQGWLYAAVATPDSRFDGLYVTKDFGQNWTRLRIPTLPATVAGGVAAPRAVPTNDLNQPDYDVGGGPVGTGLPAQLNYDISLGIDPTNPNVLYLGGTVNGQPSGFIRIDATQAADAHALVPYDNNRPDGGLTRIGSNGTTGNAAPPLTVDDPINLPNPQVVGDPTARVYYNLIRNPTSPFLAGSTIVVRNSARFNNNGGDVRWTPFDFGVTDQHRIVTFVDPLTGRARLIIGDDQGVHSAVDNNGTFDTGIGTALSALGTRNGNLQITQFYYGASQPSSELLGGQIRSLLYGQAQDNGFPQSDPDILNNGNLIWNGGLGDGTGVATDPQGRGTVYQYNWPCCGGNRTEFFQVDGVGRTFGLLQQSNPGPTPDPQWPNLGGSNFAVNPLNGRQIIMSSPISGRLFGTETEGLFWSVIGEPSALDGQYVHAPAFGAPDPFGPGGIGNLNSFLYAGTDGGRIFVTQTGGGGLGNQWIDISAGLDGTDVQAIVTNPTRGSHEAYAVTALGVYHNPNTVSVASGPFAGPALPWTNITGNLFQVMHQIFGDPALVEAQAQGLTAIVADWRYVIPNASGVGTHPLLYVSAQSGVYRSLDNGVTWALFPNVAFDGSPRDGGFLPAANVTDLDLALGKIDATTGRAVAVPGDPNILLATTFGRGSFAIRLAPIVFANTAQQTNLLRLDPASDTGSSATDRITNDPTPTILGTSQQSAFGNVVRITLFDLTDPANPILIGGFDPANPVATDIPANQTDASGVFRVTVAAPLADGVRVIGVQATDQSGTQGNIATLTITVDTVAPAVLGAPDLQDASDSFFNVTDANGTHVVGSNTDNYTNVTSPTFTVGPVEGGVVVRLFRNGVLVASLPSPVGGAPALSLTDPGRVPDGTHTYLVRQEDLAGNLSDPSATLAVRVDTSVPAVPTAPRLLPADDSGVQGDRITNVPRPRLTGNATLATGEVLPTVQLVNAGGTIIGEAVAGANGVYTVQLNVPVISNSINFFTIRARVVDQAGNTSALSASFDLTIDTRIPPVPSLSLSPLDDSGTAGDNITNVRQPTLVGQTGPNLTVDLLLNGNPTSPPVSVRSAANGQFQVRFPSPLADGTYQVQVRASDTVGNSSLSPIVTLVIDTTAPAAGPALALAPASDTGVRGDSRTSTRRPTLMGTISPVPGPGTRLEVIDAAGNVVNLPAATVIAANGSFTTQLPGDLVNGTLPLRARLRDAAGNPGPAGPTLNLAIVTTDGDYDVDGRADLAVYRRGTPAAPLAGEWSILRSTLGTQVRQFGGNADIPVQGDFDGDGINDLVAFRFETATWFVAGSRGTNRAVQFGPAGQSFPAPADFDGDGFTDFAVYRPAASAAEASTWFILRSRDGVTQVTPFGGRTFEPVPADFDGDGRADIAAYMPSPNATDPSRWVILRSSDGVGQLTPFGGSAFRPVPADFDGDGRADIAAYMPSPNATDPSRWVVLRSRDGVGELIPFGGSNHIPVPRDYDGDGRADIATFIPSGAWVIRRSSTGVGDITTFGPSGSVPLPAPLVPYRVAGTAAASLTSVRTATAAALTATAAPTPASSLDMGTTALQLATGSSRRRARGPARRRAIPVQAQTPAAGLRQRPGRIRVQQIVDDRFQG